MIGVNIDNIETLIKKNNVYLDSIKSNQKKLIDSINELNTCYSGSSIKYLFSKPTNESKNVESISNIIENYTNILYGVKVSYQQQDSNLQVQVNHMNSNL